MLVAEAGAGPYVPAVVARTLLRRADRIAPGARPCLAEASLEEVEAAMSDLSILTRRDETAASPLFQSVLGDRWAKLAAAHRALHRVQDVESFSGRARVTRGRGLHSRLVAWIFGFPPTNEDAPVAVVKMRTDGGEVWERNFDGARFRSHLSPSPRSGRVEERFLFLRFELEPLIEAGRLTLPLRRGWAFGLPLPGFLLPKSEAAEFVVDGVFHFDISLSMPLGAGAIVRYRGTLTPDGEANEAGGAQSVRAG